MKDSNLQENRPNAPLRSALMEFGHWARAKALVLRIEALPRMEWSAKALDAFDKAKQATAESADEAWALMSKEWETSSAKEALAKELSLTLALAAPSVTGSYDLHHPLWAMALRAPDHLAGTRFGVGKAPATGQLWKIGEHGEPEMEQWLRAAERHNEANKHSPTAMLAYKDVLKASCAFEKKLFPSKLLDMARVAVEHSMGPAVAAMEAAGLYELKRAPARTASKAYEPDIELVGDEKKAMSWLAGLRVAIAALPQGALGRTELARAVGVAGSQVKESEAGIGWLWSLDPASGQMWDIMLAKSLARQCDWAWERLAQTNGIGRVIADGECAQTLCDLILVGIGPWVDDNLRGVAERYEKLSIVEKMIDKRDDMRLGWYEKDLASKHLSGLKHDIDEPVRQDSKVKDMIDSMKSGNWNGRNRSWNSVFELATYAGRFDSVWRKDILAMKKNAMERAAEKSKQNKKSGNQAESQQREGWLRCAAFVLDQTENVSTNALALASAREIKWAKDHGMSATSAKMEAGAASGVTLEDLEKECARNRVSKASSPGSKLWIALEAVLSTDGMRGVEARSTARKTLAKMGLGGERIDTFVKTPQCAAYLDVVESSLALANKNEEESVKIVALNKGPRLVRKFKLGTSAIGILLAFESASREDAENPLWGGQGALSSESIDAMVKRVVDSSGEYMHGRDKCSIYLSWLGESINFNNFTESGSVLSGLAETFGAKGSLDWLSDRFEELSLQSGRLARWSFGDQKDLAPTKNLGSLGGWSFADDDRNSRLKVLPKMPYPWEPEAALPGADVETAGTFSNKKDVNDMVAQGGFVGKMARVALISGRTPQLRPDSDGVSEANAWLALGKQAAKDYLGLTEASIKALRRGDCDEICSELLDLAKARGLAERVKKTEQMAKTQGDKKGELARLLVEASSRGLPFECALATKRACDKWRDKCYEPGGGKWFEAGLSPLSEGVSARKTISAMAEEVEKASCMKLSLELAFLDRAGELWRKSQTEAFKQAQQVLPDGAERFDLKKTLCDEASDISDWANDWAGRFWGALPAKFGFKDLARGSRLWHEEALCRVAASGAGWEPIGLVWSDGSKGLVAEEITTPLGLSEEGKALKHCVGGYSNVCRSGDSRIFSIKKDGARISTLELKPPEGTGKELGILYAAEGEWRVKQHKGLLNAVPCQDAKDAEEGVKASLEQLWKIKVQDIKSKEMSVLVAVETNALKMQESFVLDLPGMEDLEAARKLLERRAEKKLASSIKKKKQG